MSASHTIALIRAIFEAVAQRDQARFAQLCTPDLELHWPASLPYGGVSRGLERHRPGWSATWQPYQPTEAERQLDPRVVAATDEEVVVLWRQRGRSPAGDRLDQPVLGLYRVRDGMLAHGQMFYFDTVEVARFLRRV